MSWSSQRTSTMATVQMRFDALAIIRIGHRPEFIEATSGHFHRKRIAQTVGDDLGFLPRIEMR